MKWLVFAGSLEIYSPRIGSAKEKYWDGDELFRILKSKFAKVGKLFPGVKLEAGGCIELDHFIYYLD